MRLLVWSIFVAGYLAALTGLADAQGAGSTSSNFLKAGQGVRAIAMGETYVSLGDGLDTLNWNPAGLVQLDAPTANFSHAFWFEEMSTEYLAFGMPLGILGTVAGGLTVFNAGAITETLEDEQGEYLREGSTINPMSFALTGGYSQKLARLVPIKNPYLKNLIVGANLKIITESLDDIAIFGGAIDIGVLWKESQEVKQQAVTAAKGLTISQLIEHAVRDQGWRFGVVAQNLGLTSDKALPINLKFGVGYVAPDLFTQFGKGTLAVDFMIPNDNNIEVTFGGEYAHISPHTMTAIRLGYKIGSEIQDLDPLAGLTTGAGAAITTQLIRYQLDYAFVPYGELGSTHRLALTIAFLPEQKNNDASLVENRELSFSGQDNLPASIMPLLQSNQGENENSLPPNSAPAPQ